MQYMGGKARIAKALTAAILPHCQGRDAYLEPFVGAGWMFAQMAPEFTMKAAGDAMPDLVMMWQALQSGWEPPEVISREDYAYLRNAPPSALRAFAGFGSSFGGKWFGGYASDGNGRDYCGAARRGVLGKRDVFKDVDVRFCSYDEWWWPDSLRPVIYCDPPYAGTTAYSGAEPWDVGRFWRTMDAWTESGALVFVSEYDAPSGWDVIWEKAQRVSIRLDTTSLATERLFMRRPG